MRNIAKTLLSAALLSVGVLLLSSCKKDKEDTFGILTASISLPSGQTFECAVDQKAFTITNEADPAEPGTADQFLVKITYTATIGTTVNYNGEPLQSGITEVDLSSPAVIVAIKGGKEVTYTVTLAEDANDDSMTKGKRVNSDMTAAGFPHCAWFDIAYFKGAFYAITSSYPDGTAAENTAYHNVYKSIDGISWTKVTTNIKVVGAFGAKLVVFKDKLYAVGGGYLYGKNEDEYGPELMWGMAGFYDIAELYIYSSADGSTWAKETVKDEAGVFSGYMDPRLFADAEKLTYRGGMASVFGQIQKTYNVATSTDGATWTALGEVDKSGAGPLLGCAAMYEFKGKLYVAGGFKNFVDQQYMQTAVYSSTDGGLTWTEEAADGGFGAMSNMNVVSAGDVLYMVGGQYFVEGAPDGEGKPTYTLTASNKVFRSTDGVHWTALEGENAMPETFTGRTRPCTVVVGDMLWIFGGRGTTNGYYGAPDAADDVIFDTWKKVIK
ncbi:MAG: exo-alpha-sialidase [Bacteroidales bacterium]|nr:exo-alpha-sialidase [Bacteroidales bacterium]